MDLIGLVAFAGPLDLSIISSSASQLRPLTSGPFDGGQLLDLISATLGATGAIKGSSGWARRERRTSSRVAISAPVRTPLGAATSAALLKELSALVPVVLVELLSAPSEL